MNSPLPPIRGFAILLALAAAAPALADERTATLELHDGDRVALIGGTFIERDHHHGHLETALTLLHPDRHVTFRNLGWSGDTVFGHARAYFGTPADGFNHLIEHVGVVKPTIILLAYGTNEAFEGEAGLDAFLEQYATLLDEMEKHTERIVLLSPTPQETAASPLPDELVERHNANFALYRDAIAELAKRRGHVFIDLYTPLLDGMRQAAGDSAAEPLTDNGIHLTEAGYRYAAAIIASAFATDADAAELLPGLSEPTPPAATAPEPEAVERLRRAVIEKNELFFHRHRPQNETYLRGFRDHEQGDNAPEIYAFEKLVEQAEQRIAELRSAFGER